MMGRGLLRRFCFLLAAIAAGGDCGSPSGWRILGPTSSPHESPVEQSPAASVPLPSEAHAGTSEIPVFDLVFDVLRIDLPINTIRHSRKVWNHVDELRVDAGLVTRLVRNGLRVGVASGDAWPAMQAIFDAAGAQWHRERLVAHGGLPIAVAVGSISEPESIFSYDGSNRLVGKTFSTGKKLLTINYAYRRELGGVVDLQVAAEVRDDRGVMTWENRNGVIRQVPAYNRYTFDNLGVLLTLNQGEFLVIGPSAEARNEYLLGSRFFTTERAGRRYESILCLRPSPRQTHRTFARSD